MSSKKKKNIQNEPKKSTQPAKEFLEVYYPSEFRPADEENKISKNPLWIILCFLVPFIFLGIYFAINKVVPFGDRTIFYADFKAQYFPFLQEFQNKLQNGGSLLWTWNSGLGSNFLGMIGYYISSPMYLLLAIIPSQYLIVAINLFVMTKFGLAGLFCGLFLKKVFRRNDVSLVAFSLCYAFSNFMIGYYWNILWLDTIALLPLVALGVYQLVYEKKYKLYVISLAIAVISNYYIGYMLCLFTLFWFFALWIKYPKEHRTKKKFVSSLLSIAGFSAIALAISAFLVVPVYLQLQNSASTNATGIDSAEFYHSFFEILGNTLGFHDLTKIEGLPNTYCGLICLVLIIIFARCQKISTKEKIVDLVFVGFMFFSLNFSPFDFVWHGFHEPNQIPSRFAFIFVFLMIIISYRAFTLIKYMRALDVAIALGFAAFIVICALAYSIKIVYSVIFLAIYLLLMWLYDAKALEPKVFLPIISIVMILELCLNCKDEFDFIGTSDVDYPKNNKEVSVLVDDVQESDTDFYRMDQTYLSAKNDSMWYGYHGIGQFSSTSSKNVVATTSHIGMVSLKLSFQSYHTSPVIASFLNLKYYICRDGYIADDPTLTVNSTNGATTLYNYNYYLPLGFMTESSFENYDVNKYSDPILAQNDLYKSATGTDKNVYTPIYATEYSISEGTLNTDNIQTGNFKYSTSAKGKDAKFKYIADKDGEYYAYVNVRDDSKKVTVKSNTIKHSYDVDSKRYLMPIGNYKAGDEIEISANLSEGKSGSFIINVAHFDENVFAEGYSKLNDETFDVSSYNDTTVEGKVTANKDGMLYTSIPNEDGWTVYVDGRKAEKTMLVGSFIGIKLTKGTHDIRFEYFPKGLKAGTAISVIAILAFVSICVAEQIKKKRIKESEVQ